MNTILTWHDIAIRLILTIIAAGIIGIDRDQRELAFPSLTCATNRESLALRNFGQGSGFGEALNTAGARATIRFGFLAAH